MHDTSPSLAAFIARVPKVELHLHLEGSVQPQTLRELARRKRRLEQETEDWIAERVRHHFRYGSFLNFLNAFKLVSLLLETPADYALGTTRLIEQLARENVRYAEITLSAGVILWKKQSVEATFDTISEAATGATQRLGVRVAWIMDAVRQFGVNHAREVLQHAARFRDQGVVAFGIGGDEERGPARWFTDVYREARELGLHTTAHAGETSGPESIREAVELLGAERIGHGLTAVQDPGVMSLLRERRIPLEVCPTSNVATGLLADLQDHPLPRLLDAGLVVTLNSDDPAMFGTTLAHELTQAADRFRLRRDVIINLCRNAAGASFQPAEQQAALLGEARPAAFEIEPDRVM